MMTKTTDLIGADLDRAVAAADGNIEPFGIDGWQPSTEWGQGGPIIERERIAVKANGYGWWFARIAGDFGQGEWMRGDTPLIAAMRCYVAHKLGNKIDIPDELI
jgi:hypothetical protein